MRKTSSAAALLLAASLLSASCDKIVVGNTVSRSESLRRDVEPVAREDRIKGRPLMTAVEFPEGYDWIRDTAYGAVAGRVALYCEKAKIRSVPAGPGTGVVLSADRHLCVDGHLYTEGPSGDGTVLKRDGESVYYSSGREVLRGLWMNGETLFTLSQNASGQGFVLRRDGETMLSKETGEVHGNLSDPAFSPFGALSPEGEEPSFFYFTGGGLVSSGARWISVRGREEEDVEIPAGIEKVFDLRRLEGELYIVGENRAGRSPVFVAGDEMYDFWWKLEKRTKEVDYRLYVQDGKMMFYGSYTALSEPLIRTARWSEAGLAGTYPWDSSIFSGESYVSVKDGSVEEIRCGGVVYKFDRKYKLASRRCVLWTDTGAVVAMYDAATGTPVVWKDGKAESYRFNGFFSSVIGQD